MHHPHPLREHPLQFTAPQPAELETLLPGYEVQSLIATGGMGAVYRAIQKSLDRVVAIKILPQEFSQDAAFCAAFEAEAKVMARLNHPNLVAVYDFGEINGMLYITMEYVAGQSLADSTRGRPVESAEVIRLMSAICGGLAHAHAHGIVHRDIKPSNILLDREGRPKIGDFGLAQAIGRKSQQGEKIFGTPDYLAPEVSAAPDRVTLRADIYSVGVMLHELLTGKLPKADDRIASVISQCDPRFDAIIRRATEPVPELRYASADALLQDLQAIAATAAARPSAAQPIQRNKRPSGPPRVRPGRSTPVIYQKQSTAGFPFLLVLVVLGAIGAATYYISKPPPAPAPAGAVAPATDGEPKPEVPVVPDLAALNQPEPEPTTPKPRVIKPQPVEETPVEPDPAEPKPKLDVPAFLASSRKIMQSRADQILAKHEAALRENFWTFSKAIELKVVTPPQRKAVKEALDALRARGSRIPAKLEAPLTDVAQAFESFTVASENQRNLDFRLFQNLSELTPDYLLGLRKRIEKLKTEDDPAAIELIEAEIEAVRDDTHYFPNLMQGIQTKDQ